MSAGTYRVEVPTVAVFGLSGRPSASAWRKGSGVVMVLEELVERWEAAYRRYGSASRLAASSVAGDRDAARAMASASRDIADVWREMEREPDLPWWVLAAICSAAQAFEFQARDWTARAEHDGSSTAGGRARPQHRLATRPRPRPRPAPRPSSDEMS